MAALEDISIVAWLKAHNIRTEKGLPLSFHDHPFLYDIYRDLSPFQAILKPAQIGASTMMNLKPFWLMDKLGLDIIYTLPTDNDVSDFVSSKTNRLIAQNPYLQELTKDRDTIEQKEVNKSIIYYRGTFTKKAAMMVPSDLNIHDELDASKQDVVADYETRLKHSQYRWRWYFSHPTTDGVGIHKLFCLTDQKHWFVTCKFCSHEQDLTWPESIDLAAETYKCKKCNAPMDDDTRRRGKWKPTVQGKDKNYSGYWISSLMCPWVSAHEIIENHDTKDAEYFNTKVLGLPYSGGGTKVTKEILFQNCTSRLNSQGGRVVFGVDTGAKIHLVAGNREGLFYYNESNGYEELERLFARFPKSVAVIDQGGDLISPRALREKYPGRVFLCYFRQDKKTMQLMAWGEGEEEGKVVADRNRMIQLVVDEFTDKRIPLQGTPLDWEEYGAHWHNMYRTRVENSLGVLQSKWDRSGPDHLALATVYWRIGMTRFGVGEGAILGGAGDPFVRISKGMNLDARQLQTGKEVMTFLFPEREAGSEDDD